jgi:putative ABC transport system permease protein
MIKTHLKTAWRNFWKHRATGFINIAGLSVGMAAAVLIFIWVQNEFNFDTATPDAANIYRIKNYLSIDKTSTWVWENSPYQIGAEAKKQIPEIEEVGRFRPMVYAPVYFNINGQFFPETRTAIVDDNWFDIINYEFVSGNALAFKQNPFSLIISESKAKKYFANQDPIGKIIKIDTNNYQVQAVIKDMPANSSFNFDVLMPVAARHANVKEKENELQWGNFNYNTFLKLKPGTNTKNVTAKLQAIMDKQRGDQKNLKVGLQPLLDLHFENDLQNSSIIHGDKKVIYIFVILGVLLLVIACINYINLTTARASLRAKEVSIKKIVGAGRSNLFMQFVAESALVSFMALILTVLIIFTSLPAFNAFTERNFTLFNHSAYLWLILGCTLMVTIVLNSIYPALLLSSFKPLSTFRGTSILHVKDTSLRKGLVVLQFTFSIFLIVGVITIYRQLAFIRSQNPGYNREQILSFNVSYKLLRKYNPDERTAVTTTLKQQLLEQSPVEAVSLIGLSSIQNSDSFSSGSADWDGRPKGFDPAISYFSVDRDYNKLVTLKMKEGRWFLPGRVDQKNAILNETAAKAFNLHKPYIGQRFVSQGDTGQVIGLVKDFNYRTMHDKIGPVVFKNTTEYSSNYLVKVAPHKQAEALKRIETIWKSNFPDAPFDYTFLDQEFDKIYRNDNKSSGLMSVFAVVAVIISCLGLFGLAAFTAEQRGKEIGIRKVLGATVPGIVTLLSREFILLVFTALVIASPLAWWLMSKWLQNYVYRVNMSWWMFLAAGVIALLIAFVTVSFQAIKAAVANPVKSLRSE